MCNCDICRDPEAHARRKAMSPTARMMELVHEDWIRYRKGMDEAIALQNANAISSTEDISPSPTPQQPANLTVS